MRLVRTKEYQTAPPPASSSGINDYPIPTKGLARKLTCSIVAVVFIGVTLILLIQVGLIVDAVPSWGRDTRKRMIELEQENIVKLASDQAGYVSEIFRRVKEGMLQVQAFAKQALLKVPETMAVDKYVRSYSGLEQSETTWIHSVWFITTLGMGENPTSNSTLGGLLNRSSLMDVPYRAMQRQHLLIFTAALDDPSPAAGEISDINLQMYAGFDLEEAGFSDHARQNMCDERFEVYGDGYQPAAYEPRCRPWYQDAIEDGNTGVIFTNPYPDARSGLLTVTVAAPVYDPTDAALLMGVVGIDMDFTDIEASIDDLSIMGRKDSYAYLLAPGGDGEVAVHYGLKYAGGTQLIVDLEKGVSKEEFGSIISRMSEECTGGERYQKGGDTWILSWKHETVSGAGSYGADHCGAGGFIAVVTVRESALLKTKAALKLFYHVVVGVVMLLTLCRFRQDFSQIETEVHGIVAVATVIMAVVLAVICFFTATIAIAVSKSIVEPVNQLIDVVHSLYTMDFSKHTVGSWIVNEVSCPEVEELMEACKAMSTVVKAANINLRSGELAIAKHNYIDALILFKKLGNDRGVAIANNNLGTLHTLQAQEMESRASMDHEINETEAKRLREEACCLYGDAITNYRLAIADAEMLCAAVTPQNDCPLPTLADSASETKALERETEDLEGAFAVSPETSVVKPTTLHDVDESISNAALFLQLSNRKFNLAMCLVAKAESAPSGCDPDANGIEQARQLLCDCVSVISEIKNERGDEWRVKYLLELANLERTAPGRHREANEALDAAERVIAPYRSDVANLKVGTPRFALAVVLPQQLLAACGKNRLAAGDTEAAINHWTRAVIGSGDIMDVRAVESSLMGLRRVAWSRRDRGHFPADLLVALGLPTDGGADARSLVPAIDVALSKIGKTPTVVKGPQMTDVDVDLCFVMDCTGSMQRWVDQAKNKLTAIIEETKKEGKIRQLRVAFVGYRDYGYLVQFEGPYDFHTEQQLPELLSRIDRISTRGGPKTRNDLPEDTAGGLFHATKLSWSSPVRLCIMIADMPCHGRRYHDLKDNYPDGCPSGRDPAKLFDELQHDLGVDVYFVKITDNTDKMIAVLQDELVSFKAERQGQSRNLHQSSNPDPVFKVHDLGSDDNRFFETMVESVKESVGRLPLILEE